MIFAIGNIITIAVMDLIGVCVNVWFLYTVKTRARHLNAIDILQVCKTCMCLVALLLCVWTEFLICSSKMCVGLKAIADNFGYYSTCLAFLAIAYTRYRASECRGQASVLLTHTFAIKTLFICFTPLGMFTPAILSLMNSVRISEETNGNNDNSTNYVDAHLLTSHSRTAFEICHLFAFVIIPFATSTVLYYKICRVVIQAARTMEGAMSSRKNDPSKMITLSVIILLSSMLSVWGIYTVVRVISLLVQVDQLFFLYWKLVVLIVHPFGEGVLQKSGKKSNKKSGVSIQGRSTRQVYPIHSVDISDRGLDDSYENISQAVELPTLVEEYETQVGKCENDILDRNKPLAEAHSRKTTILKARRPSISHPRTSVLFRNAAVIGLELQTQRNGGKEKQRTNSQDSLRFELLNIEKAAFNRLRTRRLSNCLRFATPNEASDDEIYHMYRELYDRKGSKFSNKSRKSSTSKSNASEFKAQSSVSDSRERERKASETESGTDSPSKRRWRRLYTTAKTARKFSDYRRKRNQSTIQEEVSEAKHSVEYGKGTMRRHDKAHISEMGISNLNLASQQSLDRHLSQRLESKAHFVGGKKRSISCVSNVWMKNKKHSTDRKKSVSFISSVVQDAPSTSAPASSSQRSFSYDSQIYLRYKNENERKNTKLRHSQGNARIRNDSKNEAQIEHWLLDERRTREECISKLVEMKEYF